MQLFFVDFDPIACAQALSDVHVRKMPTESAQLLSTAYRVMVPDTDLAICKSYNPGGRIVKWLCQSSANFLWLLKHGQALCTEFEYRFGSQHGAKKYLDLIETGIGRRFNQKDSQKEGRRFNQKELHFPSNVFSEPPLVMDQYRDLIVKSKIESNRNLLRIGKRSLCEWNANPERRPEWFDQYSRPIVVGAKSEVPYGLQSSILRIDMKKSVWYNPCATPDLYREYLKSLLLDDFRLWANRLLKLQHRTLQCSCRAEPQIVKPEKTICHGDVIADFVQALFSSEDEFVDLLM